MLVKNQEYVKTTSLAEKDQQLWMYFFMDAQLEVLGFPELAATGNQKFKKHLGH